MDFPFTEKQIGKKIFLREFKRDVVSDELIWHMDREDRYVKVVSGKGWELQLDNKLPEIMKEGKVYFIPSYTYHRVIKGDTNLIVEIKRNNDRSIRFYIMKGQKEKKIQKKEIELNNTDNNNNDPSQWFNMI